MFEIGIEEEFFLVKTENIGSLVSGSEEIIGIVPEEYKPYIDFEVYQCMIELRTSKCNSIKELMLDLNVKRKILNKLVQSRGMSVLGLGAYPYEFVDKINLTQKDRYITAEKNLPWVIRKVCVCGQHVHIGLENLENIIKAYTGIRTTIPELIAISTNSPFWRGHLSGLKSTRRKLFEILPLTGIPPYFSGSEEFIDYFERLRRFGLLEHTGDLRWDIRPSLKYGTLEIRVFDVQYEQKMSIALAGFAQALVLSIISDGFPVMPNSSYFESLIRYNCWEATKNGICADYHDPFDNIKMPISDKLLKTIDRLFPYANQLGSDDLLNYLYQKITELKTGADELISLYKELGIEKSINHAIITSSNN